MSKTCSKCGKEITDDSAFCPGCGNPLADSPEASDETKKTISLNKDDIKNSVSAAVSTVKAMDKKKQITIAAGIIIIILLAVLIGGGTPAYLKPIDNLCSCMEKGKWSSLKKTFPDFYLEALEVYYDDFEDFFDDLQDDMKDEYGKNLFISYKVKRKTRLDKDELEDTKDMIKQYYDERVKVTDGYELKLKFKIKGKRGSDEESVTMNVYKIDGKWCTLSTF